jgi:NADH-quinone oxidoreductase subunit G
MSVSLINVTIDDRSVAVPPGTNLIEAAKQAGIEIPHYCYHPRLTIAGNCRMCLVEIGLPKLTPEKKPELGPDGHPVIAFLPKLQIACNTPVAEGLVCRTRSPKVVKAQQGVMEFLLINHPLDCPICDQAGECRLQEFAVDYGKGFSRFADEKVHKPKRVALGPEITLDVERCIMCSRCERFMREVAGQDCLGFIRRGSHVELTCYPEQWPDTNYDLNIVDLCPVGALTSTDFRFRMRPWFLKETRSICPHCSTGCNTVVGARGDTVYRQTPRDNDEVNGSWMCDYGRLNYKFIDRPDRLLTPRVGGAESPWDDALQSAASSLSALANSNALAAIGSARASTEEQFLFATLAQDVLGVRMMDCVPRGGTADDLLLSADRNANAHGARLTGVAADPMGRLLPEIADGIRAGTIRGLLVHGESVTRHGVDAELLGKLELLVVIDVLPNETTRHATVVLPGASFAEKHGTFINGRGRLQRFGPAVPPPGSARADWSILAALLGRLRPAAAPATFEEAFAFMARTHAALAGLTFSRIGDLGISLDARLLAPGGATGQERETGEVRK